MTTRIAIVNFESYPQALEEWENALVCLTSSIRTTSQKNWIEEYSYQFDKLETLFRLFKSGKGTIEMTRRLVLHDMGLDGEPHVHECFQVVFTDDDSPHQDKDDRVLFEKYDAFDNDTEMFYAVCFALDQGVQLLRKHFVNYPESKETAHYKVTIWADADGISWIC